MDKLENILRTFKPDVTNNTIKSYGQSIKKIMKELGTDDFKALHDKKKVDTKLENITYVTKRNIYNSIIVLLQALKTDPAIILTYQEERDALNKQYSDFASKNEKSEKQEQNWLTDDEIKETLEYQKSFDSKKHLLLKLYLEYPLRNDMRSLKLITNAKYNKMKTEDKTENYLIRNQKPIGYKLGINNYKTKGVYGNKIIDIDPSFNKDIGQYLRKHPENVYLFETNKGTPYDTTTFTKYFKSIFKKTGKAVGTTMMRHIVATQKGGEALKAQKELADTMLHSVAQNQAYIKLD